MVKEFGIKVDSRERMREPQVLFFYRSSTFESGRRQIWGKTQTEFYHWNYGWTRHEKVKFLHWINKLAYPFKEIHTTKQLDEFVDVEKEVREVTPFIRDHYQSLGSFFEH